MLQVKSNEKNVYFEKDEHGYDEAPSQITVKVDGVPATFWMRKDYGSYAAYRSDSKQEINLRFG